MTTELPLTRPIVVNKKTGFEEHKQRYSKQSGKQNNFERLQTKIEIDCKTNLQILFIFSKGT